MSNSTFILPAGTYWIGDPCYPFPNDGPKSDEWSNALDATNFFEKPHCNLGPIQVLANDTSHGDGTYTGSDGNGYAVDAGLLGIMPESTVDYLGNDKEWLTKCGKFKTFDAPFKVVFYDGCFQFGDLIIHTCDEDDMEDDEYD
jgi:hypothetical protein